MKLLLAGAWQYEMYEAACAKALERQGVEVVRFSVAPKSNSLLSKFEFKYTACGLNLRAAQKELLEKIEQSRPNVVLMWLGTSILPETLLTIRRIGNIILTSYVHDDPFSHRVHRLSPPHHRWHWRAFLKGLPLYDLALFSKPLNATEAYHFGARNAGVLRQYFVPEIHRPYVLTKEETDRFGCDVAFAGHFEADGRDECIRALAKAGLRVRLYAGGVWEKTSMLGMPSNFHLMPPVRGQEYAKALSGANMCLCFMSKMNRDQYTTRCFEIPACGRLLLSERTEDLQRMFKEDGEAVFFSTPEELAKKALWLRDNPNAIKRIAQAGMRRVHADQHSVDDRMKEFLTMVEQIKVHGPLRSLDW